MPSSLDRSFESLESKTKTLLAGLTPLSDDELKYKPAPGAWSILQIVDHLVRVEGGFANQALKNLQKPLLPVSLKQAAMAGIVRCVMYSPLRVKVPPTAPVLAAPVPPALHELIDKWGRVRAHLKNTLQSAPVSQTSRAVFSHPVSGGMTGRQGLAFINAHLEHHRRYQIKRILNSLAAGSARR